MRETAEMSWRVGELAGRMGLSVRTLHHYDGIGLLSPSGRSGVRGDRLYSAQDVLRLQRIRSLRSLGFSLEEIRGCLEDPGFSAEEVMSLHISGLKERIRLMQDLLRRLEMVGERLVSSDGVATEELVNTAMEVTEMSERIEKHYTPEQLEYLGRRREEVGETRIREVEAEWPKLMEEVRAEMEKGTAPSDERVQQLARRWMGLVEEFTGGDPSIARSVGNVWREEGPIHGIDTAGMREMMEYIGKAMASGRAG